MSYPPWQDAAMTNLLERQEYDAAELIRKHPPRWTARNKWTVFEISGGGTISVRGSDCLLSLGGRGTSGRPAGRRIFGAQRVDEP